jgi:hypothetical protein
MHTKKHLITFAIAALAIGEATFAQNCALPPGTIGIGSYCQKKSTLELTVSIGATDSASKNKPLLLAQAATSTTPAPTQAPAPMSTPTAEVASAARPSIPVAITAPTEGAPVKPDNVKTWAILPTDGRLATTLERWAKAEGMRVIWDAKQHVMLSSADSFTGTLSEALQRVLSSPAIRQSAYPLEACIYPNNPPVLRVTRLSEQALECPQ